MITKPASISKGTEVNFTLDINTLCSHSGISDSYYKDPSNLKRVVFYYRSSVGNQSKIVSFEIQDNSLVGKFSTSLKVRDIFQLKTIFLYDYDGAFKALERTALSVSEKSELDVALV